MPHAAAVLDTEHYLDLLTRSQLRENQLEAEYLNDRATPQQLHELEHVRRIIEDCREALELTGYFTPS